MHLLITLLIFITVAFSANADEYYKYVKITCAKEIKLFEIQAGGIPNIGDYIFNKDGELNDKIMSNLNNDHGLFFDMYQTSHTINYSCKINNDNIIATILYREGSVSGECAVDPGGKINVQVNDKYIINNVSFHEDCYKIPSIYYVSVDYASGMLLVNLHVRNGLKYYDKHFSFRDIEKLEKKYITGRDID